MTVYGILLKWETDQVTIVSPRITTAMNGWFLTKLALRRWAAKCYVFKGSVSPCAKKRVIGFVTVLLCNICIFYISIHIHMNHIWVLPFYLQNESSVNIPWIFQVARVTHLWLCCPETHIEDTLEGGEGHKETVIFCILSKLNHWH